MIGCRMGWQRHHRTSPGSRLRRGRIAPRRSAVSRRTQVILSHNTMCGCFYVCVILLWTVYSLNLPVKLCIGAHLCVFVQLLERSEVGTGDTLCADHGDCTTTGPWPDLFCIACIGVSNAISQQGILAALEMLCTGHGPGSVALRTA